MASSQDSKDSKMQCKEKGLQGTLRPFGTWRGHLTMGWDLLECRLSGTMRPWAMCPCGSTQRCRAAMFQCLGKCKGEILKGKEMKRNKELLMNNRITKIVKECKLWKARQSKALKALRRSHNLLYKTVLSQLEVFFSVASCHPRGRRSSRNFKACCDRTGLLK